MSKIVNFFLQLLNVGQYRKTTTKKNPEKKIMKRFSINNLLSDKCINIFRLSLKHCQEGVGKENCSFPKKKRRK